MLKQFDVTVRWPAIAERVETVQATTAEEACAIVMRGEAEDLGDIAYHDDDAGDHWISDIEELVPTRPGYGAMQRWPVPAEHQHKSTPAEVADELLKACRMAVSAFGNQAHTPAGEQTIDALKAAIKAAEEAQA